MGQADTARMSGRGGRLALAALALTVLAGCSPEQSALHPAGEDAAELATLFWFMTISGAVVWCIIMGAAVYAVLGKKRPRDERFADRFVFIGGVLFPTVGLAALLVFGLALLPNWAEADAPDLRVHVTAEQYWWRLGYEAAGGARIATANEVHLPVGATAEFVLTSTDVIHSFWIPALGGKMDAIPGRTNLLRLTPTKPGIYRGVCAEFCGDQHARMAFDVVALEPDAFAAWRDEQAKPAREPDLPDRARGRELFRAGGCGSCHVVRGTEADGAFGPDLTHVGSRRTIGAGQFPNNIGTLAGWIANTQHIKPGVRMPSYGSFTGEDLRALAGYLESLK